MNKPLIFLTLSFTCSLIGSSYIRLASDEEKSLATTINAWEEDFESIEMQILPVKEELKFVRADNNALIANYHHSWVTLWNRRTNRHFALPKKYLPAEIVKKVDEGKNLQAIALPKPGEIFLLEFLVAQHCAKGKETAFIPEFKQALKAFFDKIDTKAKLAFLHAATYLGLNDTCLRLILKKIKKTKDIELTHPAFSDDISSWISHIKQLIEMDVENFEDSIGLCSKDLAAIRLKAPTQKFGLPAAQPSEPIKPIKQSQKKEGEYLSPTTLIFLRSSDKWDFPLYKEFFKHAAIIPQGKIPRKKLPAGWIPNDYNQVIITSNKIDSALTEALIPLLLEYYVCKKHGAITTNIAVHCAATLTESLLMCMQKGPALSEHFMSFLTQFGLKEISEIASLIKPELEILVKNMTKHTAEDFLLRLESLTLRASALLQPHGIGIQIAQGAAPFTATVSLTIPASRSSNKEKAASVPPAPLLPRQALLPIAQVLAKKLNARTMGELNLALAQENIRSVIDANALLAGKVMALTMDISQDIRPSIIEIFNDYLKRQLFPNAEYKRRTALTFLQASRAHSLQKEVLDEQSWKDLELFCGQKGHAAEYIAAKLPAHTEIGNVFLMRTIADCTDNIALLKERQDRIRKLHDSKHFTELEESFKKLKAAETGVFSFWDAEEMIERELDKFLYTFAGLDRKFKCVKKVCDYLNSNTAALEVLERLEQFKLFVGAPAGIAACLIPTILVLGANIPVKVALNSMAPQQSPFSGAGAATIAVDGVALLKAVPELVGSYPDMIAYTACLRICMRLKLLHLANYFSAVQDLKTVLIKINSQDSNGANSNNSDVVPGLFDSYIQKLDVINMTPAIQELQDKLATNTFKGECCLPKSKLKAAGVFFYCTGRILACFNLMRHHKNELVPLISTLAELDVLMSSAKLVKESQGTQAQFCIPELIPSSSAFPSVSIMGSWNPLLDRKKVVPNDLEIKPGEDGISTIVINGPNAGGKSSIMKAIALGIIIGQSLGIAPARTLSFTPFSKIRAYLNITDDQAGGNSLFMAAVKRARDIYQVVEEIPRGSFSFTIFDEIFNGTSSLEGEAAAYTLLERLAHQPHNIGLITTHFISLIDLENDNNGKYFANYKVEVTEKDDDSLEYPFTLKKGTSDQVIAFKILRQQKFDAEFIKRCQEVLDILTQRRQQTSLL